MANLPGDVVFFDRLKDKVRKDIGKCTDFHVSADENRVTPRDI